MYKTARVKFWTNATGKKNKLLFASRENKRSFLSDLQSDIHRKKVNLGLKAKNLIVRGVIFRVWSFQKLDNK